MLYSFIRAFRAWLLLLYSLFQMFSCDAAFLKQINLMIIIIIIIIMMKYTVNG